MSLAPKKSRIVLTKEVASEIYQHKIRLLTPTSYKASIQSGKASIKGESSKVAKLYGVSSKTIRDVWNHKTWGNATSALWNSNRDEDKVKRCQEFYILSSFIAVSN